MQHGELWSWRRGPLHAARARIGVGAIVLAAALGAVARDPGPVRAEQHLGPEPRPEVKRVVTLAPSLTELVLALGAGERLVGVTRFDDDPRVANLPRVGGYNDPDPEVVLGLRPDLVLAQPAPENRGPVEALARLGIPIDAYALGTLADVDAALRGVGARLGLSANAEQLIAQQAAHRREVSARAPAKGVRVLLVFGLDPLVAAGRGGFPGELLELTGAVNTTDSPRAFVRLSEELAVASRPERIVLCGVEATGTRPLLPGLSGVPTIVLHGTAMLHPGPRLSEALDDLAAVLAIASGRAQSGSAVLVPEHDAGASSKSDPGASATPTARATDGGAP